MLGFDFHSPLNFIMVHDDFHNFYRTYYHVHMLMQYSLNLIADSLFSISRLRSMKPDLPHKQDVALSMERSIDNEVN